MNRSEQHKQWREDRSGGPGLYRFTSLTRQGRVECTLSTADMEVRHVQLESSIKETRSMLLKAISEQASLREKLAVKAQGCDDSVRLNPRIYDLTRNPSYRPLQCSHIAGGVPILCD